MRYVLTSQRYTLSVIPPNLGGENRPLRQPCVEVEEARDALGLGRLHGEAVGGEDGAVVGAVGFQEGGGHDGGVVEVGQRRVGPLRPRVEDGLRRGLDAPPQLLGGLRPREVVVHHVLRVAIAHLQPSTHGTHPGHVHVALQHAEVVERGIFDPMLLFRNSF